MIPGHPRIYARTLLQAKERERERGLAKSWPPSACSNGPPSFLPESEIPKSCNFCPFLSLLFGANEEVCIASLEREKESKLLHFWAEFVINECQSGPSRRGSGLFAACLGKGPGKSGSNFVQTPIECGNTAQCECRN